jgi:DNA-binding transcriptional LysR family regulator
MNLDRLEVFVKILDSGSMNAAARALHLTQPALSHAIKQLEEELGALVFERRGRTLALTAAGRALEPRARAVLEMTGSLAREIAREARPYDWRIGVIDSVATYLFPQVVEPLGRAFPDLGLKVRTARTAELLQRVQDGQLDAAVVAHSGSPDGVRARKVAPYRLRFWGRADRFKALARARTDEEVRRFPIVELEALAGQGTMIVKGARTFATAASLASVKAFVLAGFGVGALLEFMLSPSERDLLVRAPTPSDPNCGLWVISPQRGADERLVEVLAEALRGAG